MKVYALVVTKDECDRYLQACLAWHVPLFDGVLVYDDQSTDDTFNVVAKSGASLTIRPDSVPTFMEHEGRFRQDSLEALEALYEPKVGDWIFVVDTDEFVSIDGDRRQILEGTIALAEKRGCKSIRIPRPELWDLDPPQERVDGFWGSIQCTRLFRWEPGGKIKDVAMGCGNEPTYINRAKVYEQKVIKLVHVGYVDEEDRKDKHQRYDSLDDNGHNAAHIKSILAPPSSTPWDGPLPTIWRGVRAT